MVALGKQTALTCQDGSFPRVFHQGQLEHRRHHLDALELKSSAFELYVENALAKILFLFQEQGRQIAVVKKLPETRRTDRIGIDANQTNIGSPSASSLGIVVGQFEMQCPIFGIELLQSLRTARIFFLGILNDFTKQQVGLVDETIVFAGGVDILARVFANGGASLEECRAKDDRNDEDDDSHHVFAVMSIPVSVYSLIRHFFEFRI